MDDVLAQLEAEYCPPIDPALLSAILSDYDLTDGGEVGRARITLDSLKESALLEEAAGFDASGTGGLREDADPEELDASQHGTSTSQSKETDVTSTSNQLSSLGLEDTSTELDISRDAVNHMESLDEETKIHLLDRVFEKHVSHYSIVHTLKTCNGNFNAAMEELLNQIYLDETSNNHESGIFGAKGIDGFAEDGNVLRGRKGKGKVKRKYLAERRSSSLPGLQDSSEISKSGIQIVPQYARPSEMELESPSNPSIGRAKSAASSRSSSSDGRSATLRKEAYDLARIAALSQANAARRKAKSDHLMGGAAAYYSEVSREYSTLSLNASAQAADQLAASQSTATELDLHGIDVRNAVRIAQERVEDWWNGLGENRVNGRIGASERQAGYRIVVGLGKHSEGGQGKLGPAVTKALKLQGWRVEPAGAVILVKGRVKP